MAYGGPANAYVQNAGGVWTPVGFAAGNAVVPVNLSTSQGNVAPVTGTLSAAAADAQGTATTASTTGQVIANVASAGNTTFHIVTSAFVGTVVFEASINGGVNYAPLYSIREDGTGSDSSFVLSTAAAFIRQYTAGLAGFTHFRVRVSAFTSGTVAVVINQGPFLIETNPSLAASSVVIGRTLPTASDLAVSVTAAASTALTATLPAPPAGQFHYVTGITLQRYAAAALTGAAAPVVVTTTNLPGTLAWTFDTAAAIGTSQVQAFTFASPIKSSAAATATTFVAPLFTGAIWRITITYYTGV